MKKYLYIIAFAFFGVTPFFAKAYSYPFPPDALSINYFGASAVTTLDLFTVPTGQTWTILEVCYVKSATAVGTYSISSPASSYLIFIDAPATTNNNVVTGCLHPLEKVTQGQKYTYVKPNTGRMSVNIVYVPYDISTTPDTDQRIWTSVVDMRDSILAEQHELRKWVVTAIYFFFSIWFVMFIWRWFFSRL